MKNLQLSGVLLAALLGSAGAAHAQWMPTGWSIGVGGTEISPNTSSSNLTPPAASNTQVDVGSDTQPTLWVRGMFGDHFAVELPIGAGFKHSINGAAGIAGVGQIGTVKALPITLLGEYHFMDRNAQLRPYGALGVSYAKMYGARGSATLNALNPINPAGGTGLSVDSKWGAVVGAGVTFRVNDKWYVDAQYLRVFLKTSAQLSTGQSMSIKLDPDVFRVGLGYNF
ncbi:MAG TPA: OmpW family outer membrane protein [Ramlibacter sp.]|jgi:outer membrane protein